MNLEVVIDDTLYTLNIPEPILVEAQDFFAQIDRDLQQGHTLGRDWIEAPTQEQCCQIVADRLLTALEMKKDKLGMMMAGYLLCRLPGLERVELDIQGEPQNTRFTLNASLGQSFQDRAEREISPVYAAGKQYLFASLNSNTGLWENSPAFATQEAAEAERQQRIQLRAATLGARH